jgi:hypothetical protein
MPCCMRAVPHLNVLLRASIDNSTSAVTLLGFGVRGDPPLLHPSRVGDRKASKRCKQNPEGAVLVEEAARENEGKCKNPHGRF